MIKRRNILITLIGIIAVSSSILIGCNQKPAPKEEVQQETQQNENNEELSPTDKLLQYNEEGMNLLKSKFTSTKDMKLALNCIGQNLPNIKVKTIDNEDFDLSKLKGKNTLITVSQAKCDSCKENEKTLSNELKDKDIQVVSLFENSNKEEIENYFKELDIKDKGIVLIDNNKEFMKHFNLTNTPTSIFIDKSGKVSLVTMQVYDKNTLSDDIKLAFGDKKIYNLKAIEKM